MLLDLTTIPDIYHFSSHEELHLREMLTEIDRATLITPVLSLSDILINDETGKTNQGYIYSETAFGDLCSLVASGLLQLANELSGKWRKAGEDKRSYSSNLAIDLINKSFKLRFDSKLSGLQLIKNCKAKVIDGVVGNFYRYLSNSDFFDRTSQTVKTQTDVKFHEAFLYGRHLVVRYIHNKPDYLIANEPYNYGFHFANAEVGNKSVRGAILIIRQLTGDCALGPFAGNEGGRVVHKGKDFERRFYALLDTIIRKLPSKDDVERGGDNLVRKNLDLGGVKGIVNKRRLMMLLVRRKLTQTLAKRIVNAATARGKDDKEIQPDELPWQQEQLISSRTGYDLFATILREAKKLSIDQREITEQAAYQLLMKGGV